MRTGDELGWERTRCGALQVVVVFAHPDDESLGTGGTLARYAAEGVETHLITATRGERGWKGKKEDYSGPEALGRLRSAELEAAAHALGVRSVTFLEYMDGELDEVHPAEATARIAEGIRRVKPQVVITFGPDGAYGHPDHIAISQFTTAAVMEAASPTELAGLPPHRVVKLYYMAMTRRLAKVYQAAFGDVKKLVDGVERRGVTWEDWAITTRIATAEHWRTVWQAIACHRSQLRDYAKLESLAPEHHRAIWEEQTYYRAFSLVNGGRAVETDLFAGLR